MTDQLTTIAALPRQAGCAAEPKPEATDQPQTVRLIPTETPFAEKHVIVHGFYDALGPDADVTAAIARVAHDFPPSQSRRRGVAQFRATVAQSAITNPPKSSERN